MPVRDHRRRRLLRRCGTVPHRLGEPRLRHRRGRGHLLGPVPGLRPSRPPPDPPLIPDITDITDITDHRTTERQRRVRARQREREPGHPLPERHGTAYQPGLVAEPVEPAGPQPALAGSNPMGEVVRLRRGVRRARRRGPEARRAQGQASPKDWWPADYGHYGPLFIRMDGTGDVPDPRRTAGPATVRSGSRRSTAGRTTSLDGRAGCSGRSSRSTAGRSWADLLVFTGNVALESMRARRSFGFGREDVWEPRGDLLGTEDTWLGDERYSGDRE